LELPVNDRLTLPNQLIQPRLSNLPGPLGVEVEARGGTGGFSIKAYPESDRSSSRRRRHDQVKVPRMKPVADLAAGPFERDRFAPCRPLTGERPVIELPFRGV